MFMLWSQLSLPRDWTRVRTQSISSSEAMGMRTLSPIYQNPSKETFWRWDPTWVSISFILKRSPSADHIAENVLYNKQGQWTFPMIGSTKSLLLSIPEQGCGYGGRWGRSGGMKSKHAPCHSRGGHIQIGHLLPKGYNLAKLLKMGCQRDTEC